MRGRSFNISCAFDFTDKACPRPRLIVTDDLTLGDLRTRSGSTAVVYLSAHDFDAAVDLVNASLYGTEEERCQVVDAIGDLTVCEMLNETRAFGMSFVGGDLAKTRPREADVVLLVQRTVGDLVFTRVDIEAHFTVVGAADVGLEEPLVNDLLF